GGVAIEVDARAVPVIVEMAALSRLMREVGMEQAGAGAAGAAHARIDHPLRARRAQRGAERVSRAVALRIERGRKRRVITPQVVQLGVEGEDDFAELRGPTRWLRRTRH